MIRRLRALPRRQRRDLAVVAAIVTVFVAAAVVSFTLGRRGAAIIWVFGAAAHAWVLRDIARAYLRAAEERRAQAARAAASARAAEIALKLGARLHAVATERGIPIRYVASAEMDRATGAYAHSVRRDRWGRARHVAHEIRLDREWLGAPGRGLREWKCLTLAHEIGHHVAIRRSGDHSEEAADREAVRLVRSLLADDEREAVEPILREIEQTEPGKEKIVRGSCG